MRPHPPLTGGWTRHRLGSRFRTTHQEENTRMALIEQESRPTTNDADAIAELEQIVGRQRAAFHAEPFPSLEERMGLLQALAGMVMSHRAQIQEAMSSDFGVHPEAAMEL